MKSKMKLCRGYLQADYYYYYFRFDFNNSNTILSCLASDGVAVAIAADVVAVFATLFKDFIMYFYFICLNKQRLFWYDLKIIYFFFITHHDVHIFCFFFFCKESVKKKLFENKCHTAKEMRERAHFSFYRNFYFHGGTSKVARCYSFRLHRLWFDLLEKRWRRSPNPILFFT